MMKKGFGFTLIFAGFIFSVLLIIEAVKVNKENPYSALLLQNACGQDISSIKSVGGRTLDEAYFYSYGHYLSYQSDVNKAMYTASKGLIMAVIYIGLIFSFLCTGSGFWIVLSSRGSVVKDAAGAEG